MINSSKCIQVLTSIQNVNLQTDGRLLIPFMENCKWGLLNALGQIVLEAKYDIIIGECRNTDEKVMIGVNIAYSYDNKGKIYSYARRNYGLVDSSGKVIFEPIFKSILVSDDNKLVSVMKDGFGYAVLDMEGNEIVSYGNYSYIDGFDHGFARVKSKFDSEKPETSCKWGLINTDGSFALPCEYSNIWNFYRKGRTSTRVEDSTNKSSFTFFFTEKISPGESEIDELYIAHYGEYEGSYAQEVMGYSDDVIDDAFDGDPEAYWNID